MPTSTIRSQLSVLIQPKHDDGVPVVSPSTGQNPRFLNIVNEGQQIDTNLPQFKNLIEAKIGYLANNYQYAETADVLKSNLASTFPQGFVLMSTDTSTGSYISYRLTNNLSYEYNLSTNILFLINQTLYSQLPFTLSCDVYTSSDVKTNVFTPITSMPSATPQSLYKNINASIPASGYIEIRIDNHADTALSTSLSNYLFISNTGTKVPAPVMTYASTAISSKYMETDSRAITLNLKPSLANDSLNSHTVQFSATKTGTTIAIPLGSRTVTNGNSVTLNLTKGQLDVGVYVIKVLFKRPNYLTNYLDNSSVTINQLSYTVTRQKIVLSTSVYNATLSYLRDLIVTSTTDYNAAGIVSLNIVDADNAVTYTYSHSSMNYSSLTNQYSFSKNVSGDNSLSLLLGHVYTITTTFTPNDIINYVASDNAIVSATVDPYRMSLVANDNLTSIKYRDSMTFTADTVTGRVHVDMEGVKSISIYKENGDLVETQTSPYTLSPYTKSNYLVGNYKAKAIFSDPSGALDSPDYLFSIVAQDTLLTVNAPASRVELNGLQTVVGVFEYSYNAPFTVSGTLKTGSVSQASALDLTDITNFVLIRTSDDSVVISSHISSVTLADADGVVTYSFIVSSPEDIGVGLNEPNAISFNVAWQPSGGKYIESRLPIQVKALKDFVTLTTVTHISGDQVMHFEDTLTITCTVVNQQPSNPPSLAGSYILKHKMQGESSYVDIETKTVSDDSNTVSFTYNTTIVGDHKFYVDYNVATPLANNFYDEIRTPSEIMVTIIKVDTSFNVQLEDVEGTPIVTASDVYKKLKYHVTNCLSQFGTGHAVAGTLHMSVEGLPNLVFDGAATAGYFTPHTLMEYLVAVSTSSFTFTFTPSDLGHYNVSVKTLLVSFKNPGVLAFNTSTFENNQPSYLEKVVVNLKYTLAKNGADVNIPLVGTLELYDASNLVFTKENVNVSTNDIFSVNTDKNPYEFNYDATVSKLLTVKFTPTNVYYAYYTAYSFSINLTPAKQTLKIVNVYTSSPTRNYGMKLGLKVDTNDAYPFSGEIVYNIQKIVESTPVGDLVEVGRVLIANNYKSDYVYYSNPMTAGDITQSSTLYQISCVFNSLDSNFNSGITTVVHTQITHIKSTLEIKNLSFSYKDGHSLVDVTVNNVATVYNNGVNLANKTPLTISGKLFNSVDTDPSTNVVSDGSVFIVNRYFENGNKHEIEYASSTVVDNAFTITYTPDKSNEIFLKYKSNVNFENQDLDIAETAGFDTFYISLINTPYDVKMDLTREGVDKYYTVDYHDGYISLYVTMNFIRSSAALAQSSDMDKIVVTICSEDETSVLYSTKLNLLNMGDSSSATLLFNPRKLSSTMATSTIPQLATTSLTKGLEAGNYVMKVMYEGIAGFYDSEQAVNVNELTQKYIKFTISQTVPGINSYLTHYSDGPDVVMNRILSSDWVQPWLAGSEDAQISQTMASFFYRELPTLAVRVQSCQQSHTTSYNADNDLLGTTVVEFYERATVLSTDSTYVIANTSADLGSDDVTGNIITNIGGGINGFKIVTLPKIKAESVDLIALRFTPNDTRNYTVKDVALRTQVKKYKPVLLDGSTDYKINVTDDGDGSRASNVIDTLAYATNGVINYDENFQVTNHLQRLDPSTQIEYDQIDGQLSFYYHLLQANSPIYPTSREVVVTNNKLDYLTTFSSKTVIPERINANTGYVMYVFFIPNDHDNYETSAHIGLAFDIYTANEVGVIIIDPIVTRMEAGLVFNVEPEKTLVLGALVTFGDNVEPKTGTLSFYYDQIDDEHLLSVSKNTPLTGYIPVNGTNSYTLTINTADDDNVMLTPRRDPYVILSKFVPTTTTRNYPTITSLVAKVVQINPSLVITISSTKGTTSISGPNTLSSMEVGDPSDDVTLTATLTHHNTAYTGVTANFVITKTLDGNTTVYVAGARFVDNVATFKTKTIDLAQNLIQDSNPISQFTMGFGEYVVACHVTFGDQRYKDIDQDNLNGFLIKNRTSHYSIVLDKTNIIYDQNRPKIATTFDEDFVYGGSFTYNIVYTTAAGVQQTITKVQELTNDANSYGANPPSKTYEFNLGDLTDANNDIIDLQVGAYSITSTYASPPNFNGASSNTVYFVVNKQDVVIQPLNNFYLSSDTVHTFTLSATLGNAGITDSTVTFVNTTTNQVYLATHANGVYSVITSGNDLLAGTYEIMAYFSGNFNYNKSNNVFSNLIVQRQHVDYTLSLVESVSNNYKLSINANSGDALYIYSMHQKEAIAVVSSHSGANFVIADTLLNVGLNRIFVTVVHPNYTGNSTVIDIIRPKMTATVSALNCTPSTSISYKDKVTLTARVDVVGRGYTVTEGETMDFHVNGSHIGTVDVVDNVATLSNVCLREMGANEIVATFVNSKSYISTDAPQLTVAVVKAIMPVMLYDETSSDMNKLNNKTVSLYLGNLSPSNKGDSNDSVIEFSRINSGTATFYNNNDIIYDNVPIINGVASISLSMDLASYSIKATFNGNVNYNSSVFSNILIFTTIQKAVSDYYASVTLAEGSKNDGKTCYIVANVALKSGVASMPASSLLLNTGVVTFTFEDVTKIVNLVDGVATARFKSSSKDTLPTIVYSNTAYSGILSPSSVAWTGVNTVHNGNAIPGNTYTIWNSGGNIQFLISNNSPWINNGIQVDMLNANTGLTFTIPSSYTGTILIGFQNPGEAGNTRGWYNISYDRWEYPYPNTLSSTIKMYNGTVQSLN